MKKKISRGRRISSRNGALFGPARKKKRMHLLSCLFFFTSCRVHFSQRPLGKKFSTLQRVRSAAVQATKGTRIPIAAGTTRAGAVFAKITADGLEIQVLVATRA
jgi:hypothetical protein